MSSYRRYRRGGLLVLGAALFVGATFTVVSGAVTGPSAVWSSAAPPSGPGPGDPAIQQCQAQRTVCDPAAASAQASNNPLQDPPASNPQYLSRAAIESQARQAALSMLTPAAPASAVTFTALMTRQEFDALSGQMPNAAVDQSRMVWVVTVHAPKTTNGSPSIAPRVVAVYSIVFDAATGHWTDSCTGCAWLTSSR
jgi:hypothetical protein